MPVAGCLTRTCFNPRPRMGGDSVIPQWEIDAMLVSIHAPAWGATRPGRSNDNPHIVSIHAPAWGATSAAVAVDDGAAGVSIHAPAWGAT